MQQRRLGSRLSGWWWGDEPALERPGLEPGADGAIALRWVSALTALSPTNVWAVGTGPGVPTGGFSAQPTAVIKRRDGTSWSVIPGPNPNPQGNNSLGAIAPVSGIDIWAVRLQLKGPFTECWTGQSWTIVSTPSGVLSLGGMSALSSGTVVAVGQGTSQQGQSGIILSN